MGKRTMAVAVSAVAMAALAVAPVSARSSACVDSTFNVPERSFGKYVPPWTGAGDKDFHGHGPRVQVWGRLRYNADHTKLVFWITMKARETKSDWTAVDGTKSFPFYTVPAGYVIQSVTDPIGRTLTLVDYSKIYVDDDHADDVLGPAVTSTAHPSLVLSYRVTGDTSGNEAGTRSGVTTTTRAMEIHARKCTT
ncbi:hypothetical protein SAMN05444920_102282 [Nonomuraea solani]|uniref:Uncharacterized protein n=1 Tax=Nonomuraea solani TaxID=1144553 RepID=A0A1H5YGN7_9ACTN|nr:hypothetical protein [Nonomuraea solani]SEG23144.1 hypothetical protein SAMN05444920_102282 [Nonomuraea solani]